MSYWTCSHAIALHLIGIHFLWCMWFFMKFICRAIIVDIVIFTKCLAEADDGPFPWDVTKQAKPKFDTPTEKSCSPAPVQKMRPVSWQSHVRGTMNDPRITSMMDEIEEHESISLWLPTRATSAGLVLQHCLQVIDAIHESHAPMTYKVGFSHNVIHRWSNHRYGYMWEKDKWQKMVVLFISKEPWSIAMLEAALIDRYLGALAALGCYQLWLQHVQTGVILCINIVSSHLQPPPSRPAWMQKCPSRWR